MSIFDRMDQHFKDLGELLEHGKQSIEVGMDQLDEEAKSKVEAEITKIKNTWHKILAYIEKKGAE